MRMVLVVKRLGVLSQVLFLHLVWGWEIFLFFRRHSGPGQGRALRVSNSLGRAIHGPIPVSGETFDELSGPLVHKNFPCKQRKRRIGPYEFPQKFVWANGSQTESSGLHRHRCIECSSLQSAETPVKSGDIRLKSLEIIVMCFGPIHYPSDDMCSRPHLRPTICPAPMNVAPRM